MAITTFNWPDDSEIYREFISQNLSYKSINFINQIIVYTGEDIPENLIPEKVTPVQFRKALNATGLRAIFENNVENSTQDIKDWWEFTLKLEYAEENFNGLLTEEQLDDVFRAAGFL